LIDKWFKVFVINNTIVSFKYFYYNLKLTLQVYLEMKKIFIVVFLILLTGSFFLFKESSGENGQLVIYKSESCGCCTLWGEHMRRNGFQIQSVNVEYLPIVKEEFQVEPGLQSCHTAIIGGYVIEGHVPAIEVKRLLLEKPEALGLAVAGMPIGSPGMEMENHPGDAYNVILFREDGSHEVYATYR